MKKIYSIVALALATTAFGQRDVDMSLTMVTPAEGAVVEKANEQVIKFTFKLETGSSNVVVGDTLWFYIINETQGKGYNLEGTPNYVNGLLIDAQAAAAINANQAIPSAAFNPASQQAGSLVDWKINTNATGFNVGDTLSVWIEFSALSTDPGADNNIMNDFGSFSLKAGGVGVSTVDATTFSAYPNPATATMTITATEEVTSVSVMTLDGKAVFTTNGNVVNVATLASGVYFYEATTVSGAKAINKFIKE